MCDLDAFPLHTGSPNPTRVTWCCERLLCGMGARKISAVDCDPTDLKVSIWPNFWLLFPSGGACKTSRWMESPSLSTPEYWMKIFKRTPSVKELAEEMMPTGGGGGGLNSYLFLLKGKIKCTSHQLQAMFDNQP